MVSMVFGVGVTERNMVHMILLIWISVTMDFSLMIFTRTGTTFGFVEAGKTSKSKALKM